MLANHSRIALILAAFCTCSCYESISLEPHAETPVVVHCILTDTTTTQQLQLCLGASPSSDSYLPITDGIITITGDGETHTFKHVDNGIWEAYSFMPCNNVRYDLRIVRDGKDITASTIFPDIIRIKEEKLRFFDTVTIEDEVLKTGGSACATMLVDADGEPYLHACNLWCMTRSPRGVHEEVGYIPGHEYRSQYLMTTNEYADKFNVTPLSFNDLYCFSPNGHQNMLECLDSLWKQTWAPGEILPNGTTYHYSIDWLISWNHTLPEEVAFMSRFYPRNPVFRDAIRIAYPENYSNRAHAPYPYIESELSFLIIGDFKPDDPLSLKWQSMFFNHIANGGKNSSIRYKDIMMYDFHVLSDEYDSFMKELYIRKINQDDGNAVDILYNKENLPCNIHGGRGIFGAQSILRYYE